MHRISVPASVATMVICGACNWNSSPESMVRSPTGPLLTTPPTYTVAGTIRESGNGRPIAEATVKAVDISTLTDSEGIYQLVDLQAWQLSRITAGKPGYETGPVNPKGGDVRLQKKLEFRAGETVIAELYPDDPAFSDFLGENMCMPCKLIRLTVPQNGTLELRLTVATESSGAGMIVEGGLRGSYFVRGIACCHIEASGSFNVEAGQLNVAVYADPAPETPLKFHLATEVRP